MLKMKVLLIVVGLCFCLTQFAANQAKATSCPELKIVFARGSGGQRWSDESYLTFKKTIEEKLLLTELNYEFLDLDYPAVGVGFNNLWVTLGAFFSGGEAYEFGDSVKRGVSALTEVINNECPNTKYVIGGYSQGAMVVSKALPSLKSEKIIYAATFGDPKIYLPEGAGILPAACKGENLSSYRAYVPDCQAYEGLLGSYRPYEPANFNGKLGTWCNKYDIFCSSYFSVNSHINYATDGLYDDAAKTIFNKIVESFGIDNPYISEHDTVIILNNTASMEKNKFYYYIETRKLMQELYEAGSRIAIFSYRNVDNNLSGGIKTCDFDFCSRLELVELCNFDTCSLAELKRALVRPQLRGGNLKLQNSVLSVSYQVMQKLEWKQGATKSIVFFTADSYLDPDLDKITLADVVKLSKEIDPVNFYVMTSPENVTKFNDLTSLTDGLTTYFNAEFDLGSYISKRFDSLPRVEEKENVDVKPTIELENLKYENSGTTLKIRIRNYGTKFIAIMNDAILGISESNEIKINDLNREIENEIKLVPLSDTQRGEPVIINIAPSYRIEDEADEFEIYEDNNQDTSEVPKAPNTGKLTGA